VSDIEVLVIDTYFNSVASIGKSGVEIERIVMGEY
jgi:hypothetical protein